MKKLNPELSDLDLKLNAEHQQHHLSSYVSKTPEHSKINCPFLLMQNIQCYLLI